MADSELQPREDQAPVELPYRRSAADWGPEAREPDHLGIGRALGLVVLVSLLVLAWVMFFCWSLLKAARVGE